MRRILYLLPIIILFFVACTTSSYTICGSVEGQKSGNSYLVKYTGKIADTLAKALIVDGKFTLTGKVECLTGALVVIDGKSERTLVFLENAEYTMKQNPSNPEENIIEGTEAQALANAYKDIFRKMRECQPLIHLMLMPLRKGEIKEVEELQKRMTELLAEEKAFIKAHPDEYVVAYMMADNMNSMELETLKEKYALLGEKAKATEPGKIIASRIRKLSAIAIGHVAPDFTLNTPEGKHLSMHSVKGKVKIIDFWASWCGSCRMEHKNIIKIYEEYHPKGLEILNVSLDSDKDEWLKAIQEDGLPWIHVCTSKGWDDEVRSVYDIIGVPHLIVVDENNVIVAKNLRGEELRLKIADMLK